MPTPVFYFSLIAFFVSIGSGFYFWRLWSKNGKRHYFLLFWAFCLGTFLLFKIPNVLVNARVPIIQDNLSVFFFITLCLYLLAYFALIAGLELFADFRGRGLYSKRFTAWLAIAVIYFAVTFLAPASLAKFASIWMGHLLFYIPAQVFLFRNISRAVKLTQNSINPPRYGIYLLQLGVVALFLTSVFYIWTLINPQPASFWYFSVISSPDTSILQIISGLLLFFGFRALAKSYLKTKR